MAISYEYEPCDFLKAREVYIRLKTGSYKKSPDDDLQSMFTGLTSQKGNIHIAIAKPLHFQEVDSVVSLVNKNDQIKALAKLIDKGIYENYKLWPSNFIAHDLRSGKGDFKNNYSETDKEAFLLHMETALEKIKEAATEEIKKIFLDIYATPVDTKLGYI